MSALAVHYRRMTGLDWESENSASTALTDRNYNDIIIDAIFKHAKNEKKDLLIILNSRNLVGKRALGNLSIKRKSVTEACQQNWQIQQFMHTRECWWL